MADKVPLQGVMEYLTIDLGLSYEIASLIFVAGVTVCVLGVIVLSLFVTVSAGAGSVLDLYPNKCSSENTRQQWLDQIEKERQELRLREIAQAREQLHHKKNLPLTLRRKNKCIRR